MSPGRRRTVIRTTAIAAALLLASLMWSGVAVAGVPGDEGSGGGSLPSDPVGTILGGTTGGSSGSSSDSSSSSGSSSGSSSESDGSSSSGSSSAPSSGSSSDSSVVLPTEAVDPTGSSAAGLLSPNALISIPSSITSFPTFPSVPGIPDGLAGTDPTTACQSIAGSLSGLDPTGLSSALSSPAATFCSALGFTLPSLPGTTTTSGPSTEIIYAPPQYYGPGKTYTGDHYWDSGYGHRYCSCSSGGSGEQPVAVTQVTTMPKGGVDTGDGSYGP